MTSVLHAAPQTGATAPLWPTRHCPECGQDFTPRHAQQLFCSLPHRAAWNNRATVRGRVMTPLAIVARQTRDGTRGDKPTGKRAISDMTTLIQRWREEDAEAGRMNQVDYLRRRYALGFDPL